MSEHEECHVDPIEKQVDQTALQNARAAFLSVSGMGCPRCATRVRNGLLLQDGVLFAEVHLENGVAAVAFDPAVMAETDLVAAVAGAGNDGRHNYQAAVMQTMPAKEAFALPPGA